MSLFKTVMIVGVVIALMPSDRENQQALRQTAHSFSAEARSFCDTRPNICVSRQEAWDIFKTKAWFAYSLGSELVWGQQQPYRTSYPSLYKEDPYLQQDDTETLLSAPRGDL